MHAPTRVAVTAVALAVAFGVARRVIRAKAPQMTERMVQDVMPRMMDACFAGMPPERRTFMLAHCRRQLDRIESKYVPEESPGATAV